MVAVIVGIFRNTLLPLTRNRTSLLQVLLLAVIYFGLAQASLSFATLKGDATPVWPSSGIALAAIFLRGYHLWPGVFLGGCMVEFIRAKLTVTTILSGLCVGTGNTVGTVVAAYLIERFIGNHQPFNHVRDVFSFVFLAALLAPVADASISVTALCLFGEVPWSDYGAIWWTWWLSEVVGILVFTPVVVAWIQAIKTPGQQFRRRFAEGAILIFLTASITWITFGGGHPIVYMLIPLLVWAAFRFGQRAATLLVVIISVISIVETAQGFGPFVQKSQNESLLLLQSFVGVIALMTLVLLAVISENEEAKTRLKVANTELQRLDKLKNEFLANTSHELRTPLNGIIGIAESLIDGATGDLPQPTRSNLAMIVASGRRLSSLVNDILDFSKLRHQNLELQLKPIDLRSITEVVLTLSHSLVAGKELQLVNAIPENLPPAEADENRLQQILYNLVGNAIKFTSSGTVAVSAQLVREGLASNSEHSSITSLQNPPLLAITVSDTGIGIPEDKFERIFEYFEQGEGSIAREYGGTGLGLAVTKQLVEIHGGTIRVASSVGVGSQFTFTLPRSHGKVESTLVEEISKVQVSPEINITPDRVLLNQEILEEVYPKHPNLPPPIFPVTKIQNNSLLLSPEVAFQILIVDDDPINLQVIFNHLSLENYVITQASNGREALEIIKCGFQPDLILLDIMMPKMTGYEVCQKIREQFLPNELPVVLLTAKNQVSDLVEGFAVGANDYLTKPVFKSQSKVKVKLWLYLKYMIAILQI